MSMRTLVSFALVGLSCGACKGPDGSQDTNTGSETSDDDVDGDSTGDEDSDSTGDSTTDDESESTGDGDGDGDCTVWSSVDGADADACGTEATPCRTLTRAIELATPGCTIQLGPGSYGPGTGESVPWELPADVALIGSGSDLAGMHTLLDDSTNTSAQTFEVACEGEIDLLRGALIVHGGRLEDFVVRGGTGADYATVLVLDGQLEIAGIAVERGQEGIFVAGQSDVTMTDIRVSGAGHAAIKPAGESQVDITGATLFDSKDALEPICAAVTTIRESSAYCNGNGLEALDRAVTTMIDNDVHHNINGVAARGTETMIVMSGNHIHDNSFGVVEIFGQLQAGTAGEPGGNVIESNRYAGIMLNNVVTDTSAIGNGWTPDIDGADQDGLYLGDVSVTAPVCGNHNSQIEAPVPDPCDVDTPVTQEPDYQNYVLNDGSCGAMPSCGGMLGPCMALGTLVLSTP